MAILTNKETLKKSRVELSTDSSYLHIKPQDQESEAQAMSLPIHTLEFEYGGAGNRYLFISSPSLVGSTLYTEKKSPVAKELMTKATPKNQKEHTKVLREDKFFLAGIVVLLVLLGLFIYNLKTITSTIAVAVISPKTEKRIGDRTAPLFVPDTQKVKDSSLKKQLKIFTKLLLEKEETKYFEFTIVDEKVPNAYATLGGHIYINSGLITMAETPEEVLGVIAHEISHVTERHVIKGLFSVIGIYGVAQLLIGDFSGIIAVILDQGQFLLQMSHSRETEAEADKVAFDRLKKFKIDPSGFATFFERLKKEDSLGSIIPEFLSSHPNLDDRIKAIHKRKKENAYEYKKLDFDFKKFKETLEEQI